jgi:hypothetical protein
VADPNTVSAPKPPTIERVKSGAAILGAIAGAITGLWGVYEKVRSEAQDLTAASYNTLAPQMNQIGEALKELQQENQQLREIVAKHQDTPRLAAAPPRRPGKRNVAGTSTSTAAAPDPAAAAAAPPASAPPAGTPAAPPAAQPPVAEPAPAAAQPAAQAPPQPSDPVTGLLNTVGRTREAIDGLRKVPETFENVLGKKKK